MPDPRQLPDFLGNQTFSPSAADIASMTHQPASPRQELPVMDTMRNFARSGIFGAVEGSGQQLPGWMSTLLHFTNSQAARDALSTANVGGIPLIEAFWSPKELDILRRMYSSGNYDPSMIPWRSPSVIRQKAFQLGLKRPEKPKYVRQPGSPDIANDPVKVAKINEMIMKNMTFDQMAAELGGVSGRSVRRYINENLKQRLIKGSPQTPSMPSFKFQQAEVPAGDPEYEKALLLFLQNMGRGR